MRPGVRPGMGLSSRLESSEIKEESPTFIVGFYLPIYMTSIEMPEFYEI